MNARLAECLLHCGQLLAAIANSEIANVTNMLGTALANMLPGRVGPDVLRYNYTQAFLPGLITAATGLSYEPCLISAGLTGDVVGRCFLLHGAAHHTNQPTKESSRKLHLWAALWRSPQAEKGV